MKSILSPISDSDWPKEIEDLRNSFAGSLNVYRVMAHNPALLRAWASLRQHIVVESALSAQQKELVILRTGYRWASEYEWAHHVARGLMAGLSRERIARAAVAAADANDGNDEDGVLIRATDDLLDNGRLSQSLLTSLQGSLSQAAIIDLMATIGMYTTLAFLVNSFDTPIDAGIPSPGVNAADN